jgi:hypothetical protein
MTTEKEFFMTLIQPNSVLENFRESEYPGLKYFQNKVGGYIRPITFKHKNLYTDGPSGVIRTMLIDEDGFAKELEPNQVASQLIGCLIVGNVLTLNNFTLR